MPFIQFQLRRGTDALWSSTNPVLAAGEMALETNTNRYKFGDGVLPWNSLPYGGTIQENSVFSSITVYQTATTSNLHFSEKMKITQSIQESIAIGYDNGLNQAQQTIAIGAEAGKLGQEAYSIAIGTGAGYNLQKERAIAIGANAGYSAQNPYSIAIGDGVSENVAQGACSIGIGRFAGYNSLQPSTIIINATGATLNSDKPRAFYVAPIATRSNIGTFYSTLYYDNATKEVFAGPSGGSASINSNYSFSNLLIADTTSTFKLFADNISTGSFTTGGSITTSNIDATLINTGVLNFPGGPMIVRQNTYLAPISIGYNAGSGVGAVALGANAGNYGQNDFAIAIGAEAGGTGQSIGSVAIGANAGNPIGPPSGPYAVAIGYGAGGTPAEATIAIGYNAAYTLAKADSIAIGRGAGSNSQGQNSIAIGALSGVISQHASTIILNATGSNVDTDKQRAFYVAPVATRTNPGAFSTLYYDGSTKEVFAGPVPNGGGGGGSIGSNFGFSNLGILDTLSAPTVRVDNLSVGSLTVSSIVFSTGTIRLDTGDYLDRIAVGYSAGKLNQDIASIGIGTFAAYNGQKGAALAIGAFAGSNLQGDNGVALGFGAAQNSQGEQSIAIGRNAGANVQGTKSIAIGDQAGGVSQKGFSIAIGFEAGLSNQAPNAVALGYRAGYQNQSTNTVVINGINSILNTTKSNAFYVAPVATRVNSESFSTLYYDDKTKEVFAGPVPSGGGSVGSNFGFSNVGVIDTISSSSTFTNYFSAAQAYVSSLVVGTAFVVGQNTLVVYGSTILAGPTISRGPVIVETSNAASTLVATLSGSSSSGTIQYSTDNGVSWNLAQKGGFTSSKNKPIGNNVAFGKDANNNPLFIAVGSSAFNPENSIQRSTDGKNWTPVTTGGLGTDAVSVAYNANTWVVGLSAYNVFADDFHSTLQVSKDGGLNFNAALTTEATQGTTFDVALKDASTFVAAGQYDNNSTILYTTNGGENWLFGQSNTLLDARGVAYGNRVDGSDLWVAVGIPLVGIEDRTSTIQWSTDAINWQPAVSGGFGTSSGQLGKKVAYLSTATTRTWVAVGSYDYNNTIAPIQYSSDGSNWASASPASSWATGNCDPVVINTVTWTGSRWVALGSNVNNPQSYYTTDESGATGWTTFNPISSNILGSAAGIVNIFETASVGGNNPSYSNLSVANTATMNTANISTLTVSTIVCSASTIITGGVVVPQLSNALYPWPSEGSVLSFSNTQADSVVYNYYINDVYVSQETFNSYAVKEFPVSKSDFVKFKFVNNNTLQAAFDGFSIANGAQIGYNTVDTDPYQQNLYFSVVYSPTLLTNQNIKTTSVNVVSSIVYNDIINIGTRDYYPIHIGFNAGSGQGANGDIGGIAIGNNAATGYHEDTDGGNIAIGKDAGTIQLGQAIALGYLAGAEQQSGAIAIGVSAGPNQGKNAIALGSYATQSPQHSNTIVINASGYTGSITTDKYNAMYVAPVATRATHSNFSTLYYDNSTKEVFAGPVAPVMKAGYASLDSGGNQLITFNNPFTTAITSVVATYSNQGSAVVASLRTQNWTTSNVSISGEPELNFGWVAMGY